MDKNGLYGFMLSVITDMELQGRYSTAHVYHCALKSALGYGGTSLRIEDLSPVWLHNYQEHLLRQALLWNTISTYMRMLRAVYNRAVDLGLAPYIPRQFKNVFTGRHVNHRRALKKEEIRLVLVKGAAETADEVRTAVTLTAADQAADQATVTSTAADDDQDQAAAATGSTDAAEATEPVSASRCSSRDLNWARACLELMLRFHGMPFVDLANLRKVDLQDGYLTVRRHKTGAPLLIAVDPAAMKLLRLYASKDPSSPYLLDILNGRLLGKAAYLDYQHALRLLNLRLGQLSRLCRLGNKVSSYTARHTWATIAKSRGIPVAVISEALGHASVSTTEGYLKRFEDDEIKRANKVIIDYIFGK